MSANCQARRMASRLHLAADMNTIDISLLATITGGAAKKETPAPDFEMKGSCPAPTKANDKLAKTWLNRNHISKDDRGNYGVKDSKTLFNLYGYDYYKGNGCDPDAGG
jgi:hypothetical protein